jgi:hypothetical protein
MMEKLRISSMEYAVSFTAVRDAQAAYHRDGDISRSLSHGLRARIELKSLEIQGPA